MPLILLLHTPHLLICRSIAQGSSEYNITVLVDQKDSIRALRAVHGRFYLATLPLGVGLVGPGLIGKTFLAQIQNQMKVAMSTTLEYLDRATGDFGIHRPQQDPLSLQLFEFGASKFGPTRLVLRNAASRFTPPKNQRQTALL